MDFCSFIKKLVKIQSSAATSNSNVNTNRNTNVNRQTPIQNHLDNSSSKTNVTNKRAHFFTSTNDDNQNLDEHTREGILKALSIYADQLYTKLGLKFYCF